MDHFRLCRIVPTYINLYDKTKIYPVGSCPAYSTILATIFMYKWYLATNYISSSPILPISTHKCYTTYDAALPPISEPTDFGKDKPTSNCHLMFLGELSNLKLM